MSRGESKKILRAGLHFGGLDYLYQRRAALRLRCGSCCGRAPLRRRLRLGDLRRGSGRRCCGGAAAPGRGRSWGPGLRQGRRAGRPV